MAQGEVSTQIVIKEKCGMGMGSFQDQLQLQCRAADVEFGNGDDDDIVGNDSDGSEFKNDAGNGELLYKKTGLPFNDEQMEAVNGEGGACDTGNGDVVPEAAPLNLSLESFGGDTVQVLGESLQGNTSKGEIFAESGGKGESLVNKSADENGNGNIEDPQSKMEVEKSTREFEATESYDEVLMVDRVPEKSNHDEKVDLAKLDDSGGFAMTQEQNVEELEVEYIVVGKEADSATAAAATFCYLEITGNSVAEKHFEAEEKQEEGPVSYVNGDDDQSYEEPEEVKGKEEPVDVEEKEEGSVFHGNGDAAPSNEEPLDVEVKEEGSFFHPNPDVAQSSDKPVEVEENEEEGSVFHDNGNAAQSCEEPIKVEQKEEEASVLHENRDLRGCEEPIERLNGGGISCETVETKIETQEFSVLCPQFRDSSDHGPQTQVPRSYLKAFVYGSKPRVPNINHLMAGSRSASHNGKNMSISVSNSLSSSSVTDNYQADDEHSQERSSSVSPDTSDPKMEPEMPIQDTTSSSDNEKVTEVAMGVLNSLSCDEEGKDNLKMEDVEKRYQFDGSDGSCTWGMLVQENEETQNHHSDRSEDSKKHLCSEARAETRTKPFNFLARVPRYDDDTLREQIRLAKVQVDEKTRFRDEIQAHIKQKRADIQIHGVDYEYAKREVSDARKLVRLKRNEIESLDHVCNKARNARSVEDIDIQVRALENKIQHETLPLKEEKRLILEIKKLNQLREELSSGLGSRNEVREALEHIGEVEEQLKTLRKELDTLKDNVLKAEESAFEAGEKYENGSREVRELQSRFRDADGVRQAAYLHWQSLKRDLSNKNKLFYKYKDDLRDANNHAFSGNTEGVHELCSNQVKVFMEMWNKSREFREEYGRLNSRSSIRRFGTLDCRSLGPDEKKLILTSSIADEEVEDSTPPTPVDPPVNHDLTSEKSVSDSHQETDFVKEQPTAQEAGQQHQNLAASAVSPDEVHDEEVAEILTEEEAEALRVAEEKRKEEAEAALREQRRQEEAAKANEARERKKKKLEQQQTRAELRLQKEAEEKEKKQEKKRRKNERRKERKKAAAACNNNDSSINNESIPETPPISEPVVESTKEKEVKDSPPATAPKKRTFSKHKKTKPLPPPLRNRNKKNWRQWMWVPVLTLLFILLLFLIGNTAGFSFSFSSLNSNW